jgi:hypothetical protein
MFDPGGLESAQADAGIRAASGLRALTGAQVHDALGLVLDDLRRWVEMHAELTGKDHFGHIAPRTEATRLREERLAEQRAAAGPERTLQARRWARRVLRQSREFHAQRSRRAGAIDFARALSAALRQAK